MHLILFDIDGTLITGFGMGRLALERAFEEVFGVSAVSHPGVGRVKFNGKSDPLIIEGIADAVGVSREALHAGKTRLDAAYLDHLRVTVAESTTRRACPGVPELLERLHGDPEVGMGLVTGNVEAGARIKLESFGFNPYFPFGGFGDDAVDRALLVGKARDRAVAHHGRELPPECVLMVGDTVHDVDAARDNGFRVVAVETGGVPGTELRTAGAHAVFPDLGPGWGFDAWLDAFLGAADPV
jgi:phosphoglycolate phosphatase-like HAD superfamily hydrolase